jgi:hypothetical protein
MGEFTKDFIKKLSEIGITAKTDVDAKKKIIKQLEEKGIPFDASESLVDLYDIASAFYENEAEEAEEELDDEDEMESDDELEEEDDLEEDDEPVVSKKAPAKKEVVKNKEVKASKKTIVDESEETEEDAPPVKKEKKAKKEKVTKVRGVKFEPLTDKKHDVLLDPLRKIFADTKLFEVLPLQNGVSIFIHAKNSKQIIFSLKNGTVVNGDVQGVLWNNRFKNEDEFFEIVESDFLGDDVKIGKKGDEPLVTVRRPTITQWVKILKETDLIKANKDQVLSLDTKMGKNREKLEASLKKGKTPDEVPVKKTSTKKAVVVDEDEMEEEVKPTKKAAKKK